MDLLAMVIAVHICQNSHILGGGWSTCAEVCTPLKESWKEYSQRHEETWCAACLMIVSVLAYSGLPTITMLKVATCLCVGISLASTDYLGDQLPTSLWLIDGFQVAWMVFKEPCPVSKMEEDHNHLREGEQGIVLFALNIASFCCGLKYSDSLGKLVLW